MARAPACGLSGRRILVTRPRAEALGLAERLAAQGAIPVLLPLLRIEPREVPDPAATLAPVHAAEVVIFVSPGAVRAFFALQARAHPPGGPAAAVFPLPGHQPLVIAVGAGTARVLREHGLSAPRIPEARFDSEGVAALPELAEPRGRRVAIVCGEGGRRWLGDALARRGARVEHIECYRRLPPAPAEAAAVLADWRGEGMDAVLITSSEAARHLRDLLGEAGWPLWQATPTFASHERIRAVLTGFGLQAVQMMAPGDEAAVAALSAFFRYIR